jgi:hypothetical protein
MHNGEPPKTIARSKQSETFFSLKIHEVDGDEDAVSSEVHEVQTADVKKYRRPSADNEIIFRMR